MKHNNISIFIPHIGCPNKCSFCNQHTISGTQKAPTADEVKETCKKAYEEIKDKSNTEIAFFGGSFTAIPHRYMIELLESVQKFIDTGDGRGFRGIRISTRPDCINREILDILKKYNVTAIELGAQSMCDTVLEANDRGHTSEDVVKASTLIKEYGFELGLQMMVGLYKSDFSDECHTMDKFIEIHPDTVRIYPIVILKGTKLAELYESGEYVPVKAMEKKISVVSIVAMMLRCFDREGIEVIKCGLHASEFVEKDMIGGFYHPAFKEICESYIYKLEIENVVNRLKYNGEKRDLYIIAVNPSCISKAMGHKKLNYEFFKKCGINIKIVG
ncbi:MAG: radical SAM protein, partial [Oscillospiraceae bacterium]|nr:radical SAM protein [Oscillospiraceae bacterium]